MNIFIIVIFTLTLLKVISYFDVPYKIIISPVIIIFAILYLIRIVFKKD